MGATNRYDRETAEDGLSIEVINPEIMALARSVFAIKRPGDLDKLRSQTH